MNDPKVCVSVNAFDVWDRGLYLLGPAEGKLYQIEDGQKIGNAMSEWTVCPVHNGTCVEMVMVEMFGYHPNKELYKINIMLCPLGVCGDGEDCPLNK